MSELSAANEAERQAWKLASTLENIAEAFYMLDREWRFTYLNREAERLLGRKRQDLLGKSVWDEFAEARGTVFDSEFHRAFHDNHPALIEEFYAPFQKWFEVRAYPSAEGLAVYFCDITQRKHGAIELVRTNRALHMLSACNEALFKVENEHELLNKICALAVAVGGYRMAYVAYKENGSGVLVPAAHAGDGATAYIDAILPALSDGGMDECLERQCIQGDRILIVEDITQSAAPFPTADIVAATGCRGMICMPLHDKSKVFGMLALCSADTVMLSRNEMQLLQKLADDLAFGIAALRLQEEQLKLQRAVMKVAIAVSASSGSRFFEQLARNMAEALGAYAGFVSRLLPGEPLNARTVAAIVDGHPVDNFDYPLEGTPCEKLIEGFDCVVPENVAQRFPRALTLAALGAQAYVGQRLDNSEGQPIGLLFVLLRHEVERSDFITSTMKIFAARAAAELERQDADSRIRQQASLLDQATDAIVVRGIDDRIRFWNKGAERLYGWTASEAVGRSIEKLLHEDPTAFREAKRHVLERGAWKGEIVERRKSGRAIVVEGNWTLVRDEFGTPQAIFAIKTDITQRKLAEKEIQELAFYDPLTRLPNRRLLLNRLEQALSVTARNQRHGALLFIDLDNFKRLNDTLGHDKGDLLLQQVATRLTACIRTSDTVARFGGDEFVIMLTDLDENAEAAVLEARAVGEKILLAFSQAFDLDGHQHFSSPSIGATLFRHRKSTVEELLKQADTAMYEAKSAGRNALRFYDPEAQKAAVNRAAMEHELRLGLQRDEFVLHYQPQFDSQGFTVGVEVLVRWQHPTRGLLNPADFIPLAEDTGLIQPLGRKVLEAACARLAAWSGKPELEQLSVSLNICADEFSHPDFVEHVLETLRLSGARAGRLKFELTESIVVKDVEDTVQKMIALKEQGIRFSLDDFGTGYSSLGYLKLMPLDELKIDQSFIRNILVDSNDAAIARTIVALADSLGLTVIAEGVETEGQRAFLAKNGCYAYQGYLFSRPLPADKLEAFLSKEFERFLHSGKLVIGMSRE